MAKRNSRFSSARFFEVPKGWTPSAEKLSAALYTPTGPSQELSYGFIPPRGGTEPGDWPITEVVSGLHIVRLRTQSRRVPKSAMDKEVAAMVERVERETGRKPGKLEKKEMKETTKLNLLPRAFARDVDSWAVVCPTRGLMVVNNASRTASARLSQELVGHHCAHPSETSQGAVPMYARPIRTNVSITDFMREALTAARDIRPLALSARCVLGADDESRKQVAYKNHELQDNQEVARHLTIGHSPRRLGLFLESAAHFEIDSDMGLHAIDFADDLFSKAPSDKSDDAFDGDFAITGAVLMSIFDSLATQLGLERMDEHKQSPF